MSHGIRIHDDEVFSACCGKPVERHVEYTDTIVQTVEADNDGAVIYTFSKTLDGVDGSDPRFVCTQCGDRLTDPRLDEAEEF